jgi:hypothetical protein
MPCLNGCSHWNVQVPSASTIRGNRYCRAAPVRPPCERRPEAVVLDLVNPQRACWRMRRFDGQARGDEAGGQVTRATPTMAAGVTSRLWEMNDIVDVLEPWEAKGERPAAVA